MKYDLKGIMLNVWRNYWKSNSSFEHSMGREEKRRDK